jgi:hypothetical protein
MAMQRDHNKTVTGIPILVPAEGGRVDGAASWEEHFGLLHPVRSLTKSDLGPMLKYLDKQDVRRLTGLVTLGHAIKSPDALLTEKLIRSYKPLLRDIATRYGTELKLPVSQRDIETIAWFLKTGSRRDTAAAILSQLLTKELSNAKLVVWRTQSGAIPAIYCDDARTALFVSFAVIGWLAICPHCDSVFLRERPDQDYCTVPHREAHRVARWRLKQKQKATGKKEKNVTRKTR